MEQPLSPHLPFHSHRHLHATCHNPVEQKTPFEARSGDVTMEAEEAAKVVAFGGLLTLAMVACWETREEEKKTSPLTKQSAGMPPICRTLSEQMEAAVAASHGERQKKRKVAEGPAHFSQRGWLAKAVQMGGTRPLLVLKKRMFATDLSPHHTRLLLPSAHQGDPSRGGVELLLQKLTTAELGALLGGKGPPVALLDRWGWEYGGAALRRWRSNQWFVVNGGGAWMGVVGGNALREGDVVEIFCFRAPAESGGGGGEGRMVLVVSARVSVGGDEEAEGVVALAGGVFSGESKGEGSRRLRCRAKRTSDLRDE